MEILVRYGEEYKSLNPRAELIGLLRSLPLYHQVNDDDREGRVPLPAGTKLQQGDYVLEDEIGCGSFGLIYAATDSRIGQSLAIKEFFPRGCVRGSENWQPVPKRGAEDDDGDIQVLQTQFEEEFKVLERFERPGIVKVYNLFKDGGGTFLVMERLRGSTLDQILQQHGSLEESLAIWIIRRLVSTLETIHLSGLTHGDIKPENLFLTNNGQVILLDFGAVNHYLTKDKTAPRFLTPGYAPPEQYQAKSLPDPASDLYAVGATLYELLTGAPPPDAVGRIKGARLQSPSRSGAVISSATVSVLGKTLALAKEKRPPSAHSLLGLLPESEVEGLTLAASWETLEPWVGHKYGIRSLEITSDGQFLASADKSGQLRLWSLREERCLGVIEFEKEISCSALNDQNTRLAVALAGGQVELVDLSSGHSLGTLRTGAPPVSALSFTPDGSTLICALFDGKIEFRSMDEAGSVRAIQAHDAPINDISFSPSGRLIALASNDRSASIWDSRTYRRVRSFGDHHRPVQVARFSPDGRFLLTGGSDMSLRVFGVKRGDEFRRLKGHEAMVWDLTYLEKENALLSCSADRTVRLWDMGNFRELDKIQLSDGWLCSMVYDKLSSTLFVAGVEKTIFRLRIKLPSFAPSPSFAPLSEPSPELW